MIVLGVEFRGWDFLKGEKAYLSLIKIMLITLLSFDFLPCFNRPHICSKRLVLFGRKISQNKKKNDYSFYFFTYNLACQRD